MSNPSAGVESKTAKKRKQKADQSVATLDTSSRHSSEAPTAAAAGHANSDSPSDSPFIKELNRQIRNIHKKISASAKADAVIADNPGKSLDELVAEKKLNNDQKAQILKKPGLQTQLNQLEEQLNHYRAFSNEVEQRFSREKAALVEAHQQELAQLRQEIDSHKQNPKTKDIDEELKVISHFLHAAASKRQSEDADSEEVRAFEGILLQIYQGNLTALTTLRNLIIGSEEKVIDTENNVLEVSFAQVKAAALAEAAELGNLVEEESSAAAAAAAAAASTDPTVAHAGLTEVDDAAAVSQPNGAPQSQSTTLPPQASPADEAANHAAETWNPEASIVTDGGANAEGWVHVSTKPAATEAESSQAAPEASQPTAAAASTAAATTTTTTTTTTITTAAPDAKESWAEEVSTSVNANATEEKAKADNDGFEPVRGRQSEGRGRGRGGRGGGGGPRGDFRGRGRGNRGESGFRGRGGGAGRGDRPPRPRGDRGNGNGH